MHLFLEGLFAWVFRRVYALVALSIFNDLIFFKTKLLDKFYGTDLDWVVQICVTVDLAEGNL
jgi:hypothetical protein